MNKHFKNICKLCGNVTQCRCYDCEKKITVNICVNCWEQLKKEERDLKK